MSDLPLNEEIELHDSEIEALVFRGDTAVLVFSDAIVHRSTGAPGLDEGTCWAQRAEFEFVGGCCSPLTGTAPFFVLDGSLVLGAVTLDNMIPSSCEFTGTVELRLVVHDIDYLHSWVLLNAAGVKVTLLGDAEFLENFTPSAWTDTP